MRRVIKEKKTPNLTKKKFPNKKELKSIQLKTLHNNNEVQKNTNTQNRITEQPPKQKPKKLTAYVIPVNNNLLNINNNVTSAKSTKIIERNSKIMNIKKDQKKKPSKLGIEYQNENTFLKNNAESNFKPMQNKTKPNRRSFSTTKSNKNIPDKSITQNNVETKPTITNPQTKSQHNKIGFQMRRAKAEAKKLEQAKIIKLNEERNKNSVFITILLQAGIKKTIYYKAKKLPIYTTTYAVSKKQYFKPYVPIRYVRLLIPYKITYDFGRKKNPSLSSELKKKTFIFFKPGKFRPNVVWAFKVIKSKGHLRIQPYFPTKTLAKKAKKISKYKANYIFASNNYFRRQTLFLKKKKKKKFTKRLTLRGNLLRRRLFKLGFFLYPPSLKYLFITSHFKTKTFKLLANTKY